MEEKEELETCGICLLEFDELEKIKILPCKIDQKSDEPVKGRHLFHSDCVYSWFLKKMECPICRYSFSNLIKKMKKKTKDELQKDSLKLSQGEVAIKQRIFNRQQTIAKEMEDRKAP